MSITTANALPETIEDSRFLTDIPSGIDRKVAENKFYDHVEQFGLMHRDSMNAEWVAGLKIVLGLQGYTGNIKATSVLLNAIDEAEQMCGFRSPDLIITNVFRRREEFQRMLATAK